MLRVRIPVTALALALAASVTLAQTSEADPPGAGTVPGSGEARNTQKPKPVLTLEQKKQLQAFCQKAANQRDARCAGLSEATTSAAPPEG
jgi:hypothetical protein